MRRRPEIIKTVIVTGFLAPLTLPVSATGKVVQGVSQDLLAAMQNNPASLLISAILLRVLMDFFIAAIASRSYSRTSACFDLALLATFAVSGGVNLFRFIVFSCADLWRPAGAVTFTYLEHPFSVTLAIGLSLFLGLAWAQLRALCLRPAQIAIIVAAVVAFAFAGLITLWSVVAAGISATIVLVAAAALSYLQRGGPSKLWSSTCTMSLVIVFGLIMAAVWPGQDGATLMFFNLAPYVIFLFVACLAHIQDSTATAALQAIVHRAASGNMDRDPVRIAEVIPDAARDPLTGIMNRRGLEDVARTVFKKALRENRPVSILMLDLDHFKQVNDLHGHAAGDMVLKTFADLISNNVRAMDIVARYGGEEFTVILPGAPLAPAMRLGERIRAATQSTDFLYEGGVLKMTVSIGVATAFPDDVQSFDSTLQQADKNLYRAKHKGRNRVAAGALHAPEEEE